MSSLHGTRILVVGGAGFVGGNLVRDVLDQGAEAVVVVDNFLSAERAAVPTDGRVELSQQGREQFRAFVRELWGWLVVEVERANGEPLDEQGREDLRTIARRQMLSDDPVTEPIEIAQAGS